MLSAPAEARYLPSFDQATLVTLFWWALSLNSSVVVRVPHLLPEVKARRGQPLSIRRPGNAGDRAAMAAQGQQLAARACIPNLARGVHTRGGQLAAIRRPGDAPDRSQMAAQGQQLAAGSHIPNLRGFVVT